ncbi:MAG: glycosyltransferase [Gaiellaceae bacterium]
MSGPNGRLRVLVLYCEEGEGHATTAQALAQDLQRLGVEVVVRDALAGGLGRVIPLFSRDLYRIQVRWLRWTYGVEFALFARFPPGRWLARTGLGLLGGRPLRRLIRELAPDVVVSNHPATTNVLGRLRRRGRLDLPVVATITDFGVHRLWAHRGADLHLVMHESCAGAVVRSAGRGSVRVAAPLVRSEFLDLPGRDAARRSLGLPLDAPVAVVSGGGWGVGDVVGGVEAALALPGLKLVVLTGRNDALRARLERSFAHEPRVHILGFTDRMHELLAGADALVDTSLGVTCLEALAAGCGVIAYGVPPGHSRANARSLERLGLARVARTPDQLAAALRETLSRESVVPAFSPGAETASQAVLTLGSAVLPRRRRRLRPAVVGAGVVLATLVLSGWTLADPTPYPLVARALDLQPVEHVTVPQHEVGLVVRAQPAALLPAERALARRGLHASFAVDSAPGRKTVEALAARGNELIPALDPTGLTHLVHSERAMRRLSERLGARGNYRYLAPQSGLTLAEYLAGRAAGGLPVTGAVIVDSPEPGDAVASGDIVVLPLPSGGDPEGAVGRLVAVLRPEGLRAVTVRSLLSDGRSS